MTPLIRKWWLIVALGIALIVIGVLLLVNTDAAEFTLALLVAIALFLAGADEIVEAPRHRTRWPSYVLAAIWIAAGVIALVWPEVTLWALAFVVGLGFFVGGVAEAVRRHPFPSHAAGMGALARRRRAQRGRRACSAWRGRMPPSSCSRCCSASGS